MTESTLTTLVVAVVVIAVTLAACYELLALLGPVTAAL
jgi:hypothetical protein